MFQRLGISNSVISRTRAVGQLFAQKCDQGRSLVSPCDTSSFKFFNIRYISAVIYFVKILDSSSVIEMKQ